MRIWRTSADDLAAVGRTVLRSALATNLLWIGALKFKQYEVENDEPLVTASPLFSPFRRKLGAQKLNRLIGVTEMTIGSLIALNRFIPKASAIGGLAATAMFLTTLSFLATTEEARQEGEGTLGLSQLGQFLLKDSVFLGASLVAVAESLRATRRQ